MTTTVNSVKFSPVCEAVVVRSIRLLEEARKGAKECGKRAEAAEKLIEETGKNANEEDEKKTTIQINVVVQMLKQIRDDLLASRAAMLKPLQEIAGMSILICVMGFICM